MLRKLFIPYFVLLLLSVYFTSCSKRLYPATDLEPILYPSPPDTARIQFLTSYSSSIDVTGNQSKFKTFVAGKEAPLPIKKPYGIKVNNSKIYIVDPEIGGLEIIDLEKSSFTYFLPGGRGKLKIPINCDVDKDGKLYVTDVGRKQVVIFNKELGYEGVISGNERFRPTDVIVAGDSILVTDPDNNKINIYDRSNLDMLFSFPENVKIGDENWLYNPLNLHVAEGKIYVTDFGNARVKMFTMVGEYIGSVGSYGRGLGQFVRPKGIAVDNDLNLFVVDAGFQNVQIFNKERKLLMFIGGPYNGPGDMYLPANVSIDYDHLRHYEKYLAPEYKLKYLVFVTNQYGPDKVNVYGRVEPK